MNYRVFRNSAGVVDAINRISDGATVPTGDAANKLTQEYQQWKQANPGFDDRNHTPGPAPKPKPNWAQFRAALRDNNAYFRIMALNSRNLTLNGWFVWVLGKLDSNPGLLSELKATWDAIATNTPVFLPGEINSLNAIASASNMPFSFDAQGGKMVIT